MTDLPRTIGGMLTRMEQVGGSIVADSPDEVRVRAREQLMQGASQVKLTAGGGVSSPFSPIDVTTFTEPECARRLKRQRIGARTSLRMPLRRLRSGGLLRLA